MHISFSHVITKAKARHVSLLALQMGRTRYSGFSLSLSLPPFIALVSSSADITFIPSHCRLFVTVRYHAA